MIINLNKSKRARSRARPEGGGALFGCEGKMEGAMAAATRPASRSS